MKSGVESFFEISRDRIENLLRYLEMGRIEYTRIEEVDEYQELRMIGLTHDQCDRVLELFQYKQQTTI